MEEVFGPITPFMILMLLMLATEWVKRNSDLTARGVQIVALGLCVIFIVLYYIVSNWGAWTPIGIFGAFVYAFLGWFATIGMYEVATKQLTRGG